MVRIRATPNIVAKTPGHVTAQASPIGFEEWKDEGVYPSLLLLGASGSGKTDVAKKLAMAGFTMGIVEIEPKTFGLAKYKPLKIPLCRPIGTRMPTMIERYDRLMRHMDDLRLGGCRVGPKGESIDLLFYDGLTEAADIIHAHSTGSSMKPDLDAWMATGRRTIDMFRELRDAAGVASESMGLPPVGIVATCGEASPKRLDIKGKTTYVDRDVPVLPGNTALVRLPFVFEVIWRLGAGMNDTGGHEWRVHTQLGDTWFAKSPGGLFDTVVTGPGGVDEYGVAREPDVGKMYLKLLTDEMSPYYRADFAKERTANGE